TPLGSCFQKCEHCRRLPPTIPCRAAGCPRLYHFPPPAAAGCFQSMKTLRLLCPPHVAEAVQMEDARCSVCDGPGELRDLVFCPPCGQHYHGGCLDIALTPPPRSGWQCPECKVPDPCPPPHRQPGQDPMMLVCEAPPQGYHTFCMAPAIQGLPPPPWKCKNCRVCSDCGRRPAELDPGCRPPRSYSVCEGCQQRRDAEDARVAPARPESPAQTLVSPDRSEMSEDPPPPPQPEPVGCDEETQLPPDPKEAPPGDGDSPPSDPPPVEVPPDELSLEKPPPPPQPPEEPPPLVLPSEEPPPLVLPPDEPPPDELPLDPPSLDEPPLDRPLLEEPPPPEPPLDEPPHDEQPLEDPPLDTAPLDELPPDKPPLPPSPPEELP
ncbi:KMT2D methyltransferase, partial [Pterocles burchelli]|nr:KMT2D methyltransferase [Pterocles burchelli]